MLNQSLNDLRLNQKWSLWCKPTVTPGTRQAGPHDSLCLIDWVHKSSYLKALSGDTVGKVWPPHIQNGGLNPRGGQVSHRLWSICLPRHRTGKGSSCGWCETHAPPPWPAWPVQTGAACLAAAWPLYTGSWPGQRADLSYGTMCSSLCRRPPPWRFAGGSCRCQQCSRCSSYTTQLDPDFEGHSWGQDDSNSPYGDQSRRNIHLQKTERNAIYSCGQLLQHTGSQCLRLIF